jgi:hypothetical protein
MKLADSHRRTRKHVGRPPIGRRPMTVAEIKRRYRDRKAAAGVKEMNVMLTPRHIELIDQLAKSSGLSKRMTVQLLMDAAMARHELSTLAGRLVQQRGGSYEEILAAIRSWDPMPGDDQFDKLDAELREGGEPRPNT